MRQFLEECPGNCVTKSGTPANTLAAVALTSDGECVFGKPVYSRSQGQKASTADGNAQPTAGANLSPKALAVREKLASSIPSLQFTRYDDEVERQRRLVCDSALGQLVLDNPQLVERAVSSVNMGIRQFWATIQNDLGKRVQYLEENRNKNWERDGEPKFVPVDLPLSEHITGRDGKYVSNPTSFGRLAKPQVSPTTVQAAVNGWLTTFAGNDLPKTVGLHDVFLKVYCAHQTAANGVAYQTPTKLATGFGLRDDWYDGKTTRGRTDATRWQTTGLPGLITNSMTIPWVEPLVRAGVVPGNARIEDRKRGIDAFLIDADNMLEDYKTLLGKNNLPFSASVSGTTSTLLTSAYTFAPILRSDNELKKQYVLACIGYLVGGGMHTCDEVFFTGGKAGLPYKPGKYLDMLPKSFLASEVGRKWQAEFWELVRPDRAHPR